MNSLITFVILIVIVIVLIILLHFLDKNSKPKNNYNKDYLKFDRINRKNKLFEKNINENYQDSSCGWDYWNKPIVFNLNYNNKD